MRILEDSRSRLHKFKFINSFKLNIAIDFVVSHPYVVGFVFIALFYSWLFFNRPMVFSHDGLTYLSAQYYFINNLIVNEELAQWVPHFTHGSVSNWWYALQAGIISSSTIFLVPIFKYINFINLYYLGFLIDELFLLVGTYLLSDIFFKNSFTKMILLISTLGTNVWITQPWFNFHIYNFLPLILFFIHKFIFSKNWMYLTLACNLLVVQSMGNLPYFLPVQTFFICMYFSLYLFSYKESTKLLIGIKFDKSFILFLFFTLLCLLASYYVLKDGVQEIKSYNGSRNDDGSTSLNDFIEYAGNHDLNKWKDLIIRVSPGLDYTLYFGIALVPFVILGVFREIKLKTYFFSTLIILMIAFISGGFFAKASYFLWPMMKYFRHLSLVSPLIKYLIIMLAAIGLDEYVNSAKSIGNSKNFERLNQYLFVAGILILLFLSKSLLNLEFAVESVRNIAHLKIANIYDYFYGNDYETVNRNSQLMSDMLISFTIISLLTFSTFKFSSLKKTNNFIFFQKYGYLIACIYLGVHFLDLYQYKKHQFSMRSVTLDKENEQKIFNYREDNHLEKRDYTLSNEPLVSFLNDKINLWVIGHWSTNLLLMKDTLGIEGDDFVFRTDHWLRPLDSYMKAYWFNHKDFSHYYEQNIIDEQLAKQGDVSFPKDNIGIEKVSAYTLGKIQFFSSATILPDEYIEKEITNESYSGDTIFISSNDLKKNTLDEDYISKNNRILIDYNVKELSANSVKIEFNEKTNADIWLFFSDVWHSKWKAIIDDNTTATVHRANLAYKAVFVPLGTKNIKLYYNSTLFKVSCYLLAFFSFLWLNGLFYLLFNLNLKRPKIY